MSNTSSSVTGLRSTHRSRRHGAKHPPADFTNLSEVVTVGNGTATAYQAAAENALASPSLRTSVRFCHVAVPPPSDACVQGFIRTASRARSGDRHGLRGERAMGIFHSGESSAAGIQTRHRRQLSNPPSFLYRSELGVPTSVGRQRALR